MRNKITYLKDYSYVIAGNDDIIYAGNNCKIKCGDNCVIYAGDGLNLVAGNNTVIVAKNHFNIKCESNCTINVKSYGNVNAKNHSTCSSFANVKYDLGGYSTINAFNNIIAEVGKDSCISCGPDSKLTLTSRGTASVSYDTEITCIGDCSIVRRDTHEMFRLRDMQSIKTNNHLIPGYSKMNQVIEVEGQLFEIFHDDYKIIKEIIKRARKK